MNPSCLIKVPSSLEDGSFYKWWIRFLSPFHSLTEREMDVAAALFRRRYELSKTVHDPVLLDKVVLDADSRKVIENELNLKYGYMKLILTKLRKNKIIKDGRLNPKFVPNIEVVNGKPKISVLIVFDLKHAEG